MKEEKESNFKFTEITENQGHVLWDTYRTVTDLAEDIEWDFKFTKLESMKLATHITQASHLMGSQQWYKEEQANMELLIETLKKYKI